MTEWLINDFEGIRLLELSAELGLLLTCATLEEAKAIIYDTWKGTVPQACHPDKAGQAACERLTRLTDAWHEVNRWML